MSKLGCKLLKSVDGRKTKCSYCGNPIKKGEMYVAVFRKINRINYTSNEIRNVCNYCEYCWNGWAKFVGLPYWNELARGLVNDNEQ